MREIKFREWDATREELYGKGYGMSYAKRVEYDDNTSFVFSHEEDLGHDGWDKIGNKRYRKLMQYTGLKDTTGKEIYELDVVENERGKLYLINFHEGSFLAGDYFFGSISAGKEISVVGNIYENPELLYGVEK